VPLSTLVAVPCIDDPVLPVDSLLGDGAPGLLGTAVAGAGGDLCSAEPRQVIYHPGRSLTVRFDAELRWPGAGAQPASLVASVGDPPPDGAAIVDDGDHTVAVWQMPHDPYLPGLALALDPTEVRLLLADLGATVSHPSTRLRSYRPGRGATVQVDAGAQRFFLKVVRERAAPRLHQRHMLLADHVPVPRSLGWSEHGIVVVQALGGSTLRHALLEGASTPPAYALTTMLDSLPAPQWPTSVPDGWRSERSAGVVAALLPHLRPRVDALAATLADAEHQAADEPLAPVHGDFHDRQLLVRNDRVCGLVDVDDFGVGQRLDDLATLVGHLSAFARAAPHPRPIEQQAARLLDHFDRCIDPVLLRYRVAAVVLGSATAPFRALEHGWPAVIGQRVELAEQWASSARRLAGRSA
jgi:hypothetical protein